MNNQFDLEEDEDLHDPFNADEEPQREYTDLWVVSYSDFMTILMIFFLMLFAHRVWAKKVSWDDEKMRESRAVQETQQGMVQRLARLTNVDVQAQRINIHLPDALLFDAGHADLRDGARDLLARISPELNNFNGEIVVEGHTDNRPTGKGSRYQSNWELSVARAFSVIQCLQANGLNPERLSARGYGAYRPRVPNDTVENRSANRRIEIVLLNRQSGGAH